MESQACVLFLDEIDALGQSRGDSAGGGQAQGGDSCSRRVLAELLIQLTKVSNERFSAEEEETSDLDQQGNNDDGDEDEMAAGPERNEATAVVLESANDDGQQVRVIVVAATNRPSDCDPALLRRFGVRVHVGLPNKQDRYRILKRLLKDIAHTIDTLALKDLAGALEGWSGSEIENLAREAAMAPVRECIRMAARKKRRTKYTEKKGQEYSNQIDEDSRSQAILAFEDLRPVTLADFEAAVEFFSGNNDATSNGSYEPDGARSKNAQYDSSSSESDDEDHLANAYQVNPLVRARKNPNQSA
jgi:SpoVK/Ycf46/Vps4 family AAA+-type ATPase